MIQVLLHCHLFEIWKGEILPSFLYEDLAKKTNKGDEFWENSNHSGTEMQAIFRRGVGNSETSVLIGEAILSCTHFAPNGFKDLFLNIDLLNLIVCITCICSIQLYIITCISEFLIRNKTFLVGFRPIPHYKTPMAHCVTRPWSLLV